MAEVPDSLALILALLILFVGLIGTVLPIIPGTILIFAGALLYAILEGFQVIGWPTLAILGLLALVATTADIWATTVGARLGGASGWSILAGLVGGVVGLIFLNLPGALGGAVLGVLLVEIARAGDWRRALKAGSGWAIGWLVSTAIQLLIGLVMVAIFLWQVKQGL